MTQLETDYLIVGSGAMGMAFADTMLTETDADIVIVDKHHKPGGHWNDAYSFVTLHQPSSYYGVSSKELSNGRKDTLGLNAGLNDLATGAEILSYFDDVMRHTFLPSGRVHYFPMSEYLGNGLIRSLLSGEETQIDVRRKTVDSTYLKTTVPSTHQRNYEVASGIVCVPPNDLPQRADQHKNYMVIGGGKTGMDAVTWLLGHGAPPERIKWVMPRDGWLLAREKTQPTDDFFFATMGAQASQMEALANATSIDDVFDRLEAAGVFVRIDEDVRPEMFHGATISLAELETLRRIKDIVRLGRVKTIEADEIVFEQGVLPALDDTLYVDCTAIAVGNLETTQIFKGDLITLQPVRAVQPVFSAAFIAHIEATYTDEAEMNRLCTVVPLPNHDTDWLRAQQVFMMNQFNWSQIPDLRKWLLENRLDGYSRMVRNAGKDDPEKQAVLQRMRDNAMPAMAKLNQFLAEL
ncbi:MAG: NAD(P)-binding protein [Pseudomonadota bacterium]